MKNTYDMLKMMIAAGGIAVLPALDAALLHDDWAKPLSVPSGYSFKRKVELVKTWRFADFDVEAYRQANGPGTFQRVFVAVPKRGTGRLPAVAVPFYFPECMIGFDPATGERLEKYECISMMADLAKRGFVTASADAYHLTYLPDLNLQRSDFSRWRKVGEALGRDWPGWSGVGKLVADTRLMVDLLESHPRVDAARIGIIGHSLGGKMAFYTGCLDKRIKAIVASDWGIVWNSTNWNDVWYWGARAKALEEAGHTHAELLDYAGGKPFMLIAGKFDGEPARRLLDGVEAYRKHPGNLEFLNHASGHRPPPAALEAGYRFLERNLAPKQP